MAFREVRVFEVREVLRLWLAGEGIRATERLVGFDRKTVRRYVDAAVGLGGQFQWPLHDVAEDGCFDRRVRQLLEVCCEIG